MNTIIANTTSQQTILDNLCKNVALMSVDPTEDNSVEQICIAVADIAIHNAEMYAAAATDCGPVSEWKQFVANVHADQQWNDDVDWLSALDEAAMVQYLLDRYNESQS